RMWRASASPCPQRPPRPFPQRLLQLPLRRLRQRVHSRQRPLLQRQPRKEVRSGTPTENQRELSFDELPVKIPCVADVQHHIGPKTEGSDSMDFEKLTDRARGIPQAAQTIEVREHHHRIPP